MVMVIAVRTTASSSHTSLTWWYFARTTADSGETILRMSWMIALVMTPTRMPLMPPAVEHADAPIAIAMVVAIIPTGPH